MAQHVLALADLLPEDDPKFDSICIVIDEKQKQDNSVQFLPAHAFLFGNETAQPQL